MTMAWHSGWLQAEKLRHTGLPEDPQIKAFVLPMKGNSRVGKSIGFRHRGLRCPIPHSRGDVTASPGGQTPAQPDEAGNKARRNLHRTSLGDARAQTRCLARGTATCSLPAAVFYFLAPPGSATLQRGEKPGCWAGIRSGRAALASFGQSALGEP